MISRFPGSKILWTEKLFKGAFMTLPKRVGCVRKVVNCLIFKENLFWWHFLCVYFLAFFLLYFQFLAKNVTFHAMNLTPLVIRDWAGAIRCHRSHWSRKTKKKHIALFTWVALAKPEGVIHINDVEICAMKNLRN